MIAFVSSKEMLLTIGWDIEEAPSKLQRTCMEILHVAKHQDCVEGCNTQWLCMARGILQQNGISETEFAKAVQTLLIKRRGKNRNILLIGPCSCGKTFLLNPLIQYTEHLQIR